MANPEGMPARIKHALRGAGLSVSALAEAWDVDRSGLSDRIHGERLSEAEVERIAEATGTSPVWLRYGVAVIPTDQAHRDGFRQGWTTAVAELRRFVEELESALPVPNAVRPADSASGGAETPEIPMIDAEEFVEGVEAPATPRAASGGGRRDRGSP